MTSTGKPRRIDGQMRFGMMWPNTPSQNATSGVVAARNPQVLDLQEHLELARTVERIGLDYVFFADSYTVNAPASVAAGHGEPRIFAPIWAAAVIAATQHIGVVTTLHTRYLPPALIARVGANLDVMSGGRWGWNIVPGSKPVEGALFGIGDQLDHDRRYDVARETLEAVKLLWSNGTDPTDYHGEHVSVEGALCGPTPVQQPFPVIFNPGVSASGVDLIATACDVGFSAVVDDLDAVRASVDLLADRARSAGRPDGAVQMAGSIGVVLGDTQADADETYQWLKESVDLGAAEGFANFFLNNSQTYQRLFEGVEHDEVVRRIGVGAGSTVLVGTAEIVAERLVAIHRATGLCNFLLLPFLWSADNVARYEELFPHLARAGVWTAPSERCWSW